MTPDMVRVLAYGCMCALQDTTLAGGPSVRTQQVRRRMEALLPGDWVVETSAALFQHAAKGAGRLILRREEPIPGDWDPEDGTPMEAVWYIETPEGALARWVNADFLSLPVDVLGSAEWAKEAVKRHGLETP